MSPEQAQALLAYCDELERWAVTNITFDKPVVVGDGWRTTVTATFERNPVPLRARPHHPHCSRITSGPGDDDDPQIRIP
jgi:hypothetical protein